jgi:hypothetical protein
MALHGESKVDAFVGGFHLTGGLLGAMIHDAISDLAAIGHSRESHGLEGDHHMSTRCTARFVTRVRERRSSSVVDR